jgi:hypothetical protein
MIRPFTFLTMLLAAVSGAYLFAVKHRAQVLDAQLASVTQAARLDQQRIRVLQAQWALEIDPNRLTSLTAKFSRLQPMKPAQLVTLAALPNMLPPAGSAAPGANPVAPAIAPAVADVAQAAPDAATAQVAMLPMPPPEAPGAAVPDASSAMPTHAVPSPAALRAMLSGKPGVARPARVASAARKTSASHLARSEWAENLPPPRPLAPPEAAENATPDAAENAPMGARVMSVSASPMAAPPPGDAPGGSLLGIATDMAPPQPLGQGAGN